MGRPPRPAAHRRAPWPTSPGADAAAGRARRRSPSVQLALSALDRLEVRGRDSAGLTCSCATTGSTSPTPARRRRCSPAAPATRSSRRARCGHAGRPPELRLQGGGRDRRARRQHRGAARRHPRRRPAAPGAARRPAPRSPCSATPAGPASASSPSPTPTRSTPRRSTAPSGPYVDRRAQRRRRQLRRPEGRRRPAHRRPRSPPTPRSSPRSCRAALADGADARRGVPRARSASFDGSVAIARQRRAPTPDQLLLALRGSGQALYVGLAEDAYVVASEPYGAGRGDAHATSAWTARRRPTPTNPRQPRPGRRARRRRRRHARGHRAGSPTTAPSCRSTTTSCARAEITTRDIDRGDYPHFLLKEITEAPGVVPQDAAGQARRATTALLRGRARRRRRCPPTLRAGLRDGAHPPRPGHRPGHGRGRRPEPGRARSTRRSPTRRLARRGRAGHRAVGLRAARRHDRHAGRRHQPVGHHHRHQPHRRPGPRPRRRGDRHRQPARQRPHRQGRRRALHVRRPRRGDERGVDQGVLRPDRGRVPAGRAPSPTRSARGATTASATSCSPALRELPDAMEAGAGPPAAASPRPPSGSRRRRRYWAIVGNGANRIAAEELRIKLSELCYKSIACDATEDKKHIDLSSRAADPRVRRRPDRLDRRRRGQGGGDLPGPQGGADRDRHRGRGALRRRAAGASRCRPSHPALAFVLSAMVGPPLRLRGGAGHRRPGPPAARGARRHRGRGRPHGAADGDALLADAARRRSTPLAAPLLRRPAQPAPTTATSRPAPRCGWRRCSATPPASLPLDAYQLEHGKVGTPERRGRRPHRRAHRRHRGAHPPRRRHQAPGQDRHRRHLPLATRACCSVPLVRERARRRRRPRPAQLPDAAHAGRPRRRPSTRWSATPATASRATLGGGDATIEVVDRGGIGRDLPSRTERNPQLRGTKHRVAAERRGHWWRGAAATAARVLIVPEVKGNAGHGITLLHVRFADRLPAATAMRRCCRATAAATTPSRTPSPRPSRRSATTCSADRRRRRPADRAGRTSSPTAGGRDRRGLIGVIGVGIDAVDVDRFAVAAGPPAAAGRAAVHRRRAGRRRRLGGPSGGAVRGQGGGDEGAGRGPGGVRCRDVEVVRLASGAPALRLHGAAQRLALGRGVQRWHVSLTHTALTAQAIALAE